jgi:hypothetical protein
MQVARSLTSYQRPFIAIALGATFAVGVYAMWLVALLRHLYGRGAKTTIIAGFAVWLLIAITDFVWGSFGLMPMKALLAPVVCAFPEIVIALFVGARFYNKE